MKDKILEGDIRHFAEEHGLSALSASEQFLHFVNFCALSKNTSDIFDSSDILTDGGNDLGIDAIAALIAGHLVTSEESLEDYRRSFNTLDVTFIFIQAKSSSTFSSHEIGTFFNGVKRFLDSDTLDNANEAICKALTLKNAIYRNSAYMPKAPKCILYYATSGTWLGDTVLVDRVESERKPFTEGHACSEINFMPLDGAKLHTYYREAIQRSEETFEFPSPATLPLIKGVEEAYIGTISWKEYQKLVTDKDGNLNHRVFIDNVRAFQGYNSVNSEIKDTLLQGSFIDRFVLYNNGITVVARSMKRVRDSFTITDYQVVNGCQTSHVLYDNRDIITDGLTIPLKLVVTNDSDITNKVIRATNRQTLVLDEAFESIEAFHRGLEEFYNTFNGNHKLYYERRSNQYWSQSVDKTRIVTLAGQIFAYVGVFLDEPHQANSRYYGELLRTLRTRLFQTNHRYFPYYLASLIHSNVLRELNRLGASNRHRSFRYHIGMLIRHQLGGAKLPAAHSNQMDIYCEKLLERLLDGAKFESAFEFAIKRIQLELADNIDDKLYLAHRRRDFTLNLINDPKHRPIGKIKSIDSVKGYGFIELTNHRDVYFRVSELPSSIGNAAFAKGTEVEFDIVEGDPSPRAENIQVV